jgi:hypothetical protein
MGRSRSPRRVRRGGKNRCGGNFTQGSFAPANPPRWKSLPLRQSLFWYPHLPFVYDMFYFPSPFMKFPCNPFPVAFPGKSFRTYNDRGFSKCNGFKQINPSSEIISKGVCDVSAFSESPKFCSKEVIFYPFKV